MQKGGDERQWLVESGKLCYWTLRLDGLIVMTIDGFADSRADCEADGAGIFCVPFRIETTQ
jgi:hypothetical protein